MIKSILLPLLLAVSTPVLATPGGVWYKDMYSGPDELPSFCAEIREEVQSGEDEGLFTPGYAEDVYIRCLEWTANN